MHITHRAPHWLQALARVAAALVILSALVAIYTVADAAGDALVELTR